MATCSGVCGIHIDCGDRGCGILCTSDCTDCTQWCEPTHLPAVSMGGIRSPGVLVRVIEQAEDARVRIWVGEAAERPNADAPKHPENTEFRLSFHDLSRAGLARLLSSMHTRPVRSPEGDDAEKLSGTASGTVADLAAKYSLIVE